MLSVYPDDGGETRTWTGDARIFSPSLYQLSYLALSLGFWWGREDSNFHNLYGHKNLNLACLPVPPRPRVGIRFRISTSRKCLHPIAAPPPRIKSTDFILTDKICWFCLKRRNNLSTESNFVLSNCVVRRFVSTRVKKQKILCQRIKNPQIILSQA